MPASWPWLDRAARGGAIGADVLFVVSGFVLAMSADRLGTAARESLLNRATRALPLYLLASLPFLVAGPASWLEGLDRLPSGQASWVVAWNSLAFLPVLDQRGVYTYPAHPFGWTVAAELWFYLVFAAAIRWAPERGRVEALAASAALLVAAGCLFGGEWVLPRFLGQPMVLEFAAGALLYRWRRALGRGAGLVLAPFGALLLALAAADFKWAGYHVGFATHVGGEGNPAAALLRVLLWGAPSAMLVAGTVALDRAGFRWPTPLVRVRDSSYSVHLAQPFAIVALASVAWSHFVPAWAALLGLVLAMAWASHRWIERPATCRLRALLRERAGADGALRAGATAA